MASTKSLCSDPVGCAAIHELRTNVTEMNTKLTSVFAMLQLFFDSWKHESRLQATRLEAEISRTQEAEVQTDREERQQVLEKGLEPAAEQEEEAEASAAVTKEQQIIEPLNIKQEILETFGLEAVAAIGTFEEPSFEDDQNWPFEHEQEGASFENAQSSGFPFVTSAVPNKISVHVTRKRTYDQMENSWDPGLATTSEPSYFGIAAPTNSFPPNQLAKLRVMVPALSKLRVMAPSSSSKLLASHQARTIFSLVDRRLTKDEILEQDYTFDSLQEAFAMGPQGKSQKLNALKFMARHGLIANRFHCTNCSGTAKTNLIYDGKSLDGFFWRCLGCRREIGRNTKKSVREGSFVWQAHLSFGTTMGLLYYWANFPTMRYDQIMTDIGLKLTFKTMMDWSNLFGDICKTAVKRWAEERGNRIGGPGITLILTQEQFYTASSHVPEGATRPTPRQHVYANLLIETETSTMAAEECEDRTIENLLQFLVARIAPKSKVAALDQLWREYGGLDNVRTFLDRYLENEYGQRQDHDFELVLASDEETLVKNQIWGEFMNEISDSSRRSSRPMFVTYLYRFMFRYRYKNEKIFNRMLIEMAAQYPVTE